MRVVLRTGQGEVDAEVVVHDPAASVADLAAALAPALGGRAPAAVEVDGCHRAGSVPLADSGLRAGCELGLGHGSGGSGGRGVGGDGVPDLGHAVDLDGSTAGQPPDPEAGPELRVVGGLAAGGRHGLPPGRSVVGRDPTCQVVLPGRTTSRRHATVEVAPGGALFLADAGSEAGTWVDGRRTEGTVRLDPSATAALGSTLVQLGAPRWREPAVLGRTGTDGRRPFHRPPPPAPLPPVAALTPPAAPAGGGEAPRFAWAAALVPLVGGLVLARLVDPRLALFTLLGPAVLAGQWIEERRRHRRAGAGARVAAQEGLAAFARDLDRSAEDEALRRHRTHPDPAALGAEVEAVGAALWSRRAGHTDFAAVAVGAGPALRWEPPVTGAADGPAAALLAEARLPHGCPAVAPLGPGHHLGVAGPREGVLAAARWVLLQLAAHHGPGDLRLGVVCAAGREDDWAWLAFLPHVTTSSSGRRLLGTGPVGAAEVAELASAGTSGHAVVVVDAEGSVECSIPVATDGPSLLVIATSRRALSSRCTSVLELDGPDGWGRLATADAGPQALLATGVALAAARRWARSLAGLADPEVLGGQAPVPASVRLLDLLHLDEPTAPAVRRRWDDRSRPGLLVPIGCTGGRDGPETVTIDLVADGPHALVAGTTGAGKSELLRSLVAGLAASYPPDRLALLLVDYKGGAAFAEAARLPHVLGVVTDLGPDEAARALRSLEAELRRREQVLSQLGLRDLAAHPGHAAGQPPPGTQPLPRIVVVVDELAALVAELPSFLDGLVQLAARGRSLGLHLVLGTQRPGGVVSAAVRANCALRCCLRVPDEADALDVVGSAAPAHVDRSQPGRAFVRRGARDLVEVQVGLVGGGGACGAPVTVAPATFGTTPVRGAARPRAGDGDLADLVGACRRAADEAGAAPPRPLWLPPLPVALDATALDATALDATALDATALDATALDATALDATALDATALDATALDATALDATGLARTALPPAGTGLVLGLVDDPDHQRRLPLEWRPTHGPLLAVGSGLGPATALRAAARALAARHGPGRLHVYGFDLAAQGLAPLSDLPHVGAIVRPGEQERLHRLIGRLADELADRQAAAAGDPARAGARPLVLVLVDGVGALRGALEGTGGLAALDALERVVADGAPLGLVVAAAADRPASIPAAWSAAASARLVFRCGDPFDLLSIGAGPVDQTRWPHGRCLELGSGLVAQVATGSWPSLAAGEVGEQGPGPAPVVALPTRVPVAAVLDGAGPQAGPDGLRLPLGIDGRHLGVAVARLRPGRPFVVCGPPGSGRSTTLAMLRRVAEGAGCQVLDPGSSLAARLADATAAGRRSVAVVVDHADRTDDPDGALAELAAGRHPSAHLVAAVAPAALRTAFGHWSADLRRAGSGLVLRPRSDLDADVLGIPVLPRWPVSLSGPGRGVLVTEGEAVPVQVALP